MIDASLTTCRKCACACAFGANASGRPALYCSTGCRRAAEYELRRIQTRLAMLENQLSDCKLNRSPIMNWDGTSAEERATHLREVIAEEEARFKALLGSNDSQEPETFKE